jgi:putative endonuclease
MRVKHKANRDPQIRRRAEQRGRFAEIKATLWLRVKGYRIVAKRLRTPFGEIDLIARKGQVLAFIEVKARTDLATALEAVTPTQCQRIERSAQYWTRSYTGTRDLQWRFDLIAIVPGWHLPHHLKDAWRPSA